MQQMSDRAASSCFEEPSFSKLPAKKKHSTTSVKSYTFKSVRETINNSADKIHEDHAEDLCSPLKFHKRVSRESLRLDEDSVDNSSLNTDDEFETKDQRVTYNKNKIISINGPVLKNKTDVF